ncbi:hypothetical protein Mgra_00003714 [Meloidogyne graminicola]|uniref:Candidate secreted effector n=1 Tax=Meloidogyne graminicola TaxID=189291 RepID=A0A8S9ZUA1_9BILA|nr:hypothetical protein Mgra_00003714 [Meloidogyne graminicola]
MKILLTIFFISLILAFTYAKEKIPENEGEKDEKTLLDAKKEENPINPEIKPNLVFQAKAPAKAADGPVFTEKTGDGKEGRHKRWWGGWGGCCGGWGGWGGYGGWGGWGGYGGYGGYGWGWGRR